MGLYGLPLGTAPGTTEAVIHQQSNQAYAEFRKQMLSTSQFGKTKRGGSRNTSPYPMSSDHMDDHLSETGSLMRANDSGSASDDGNPLTNGKSRLGKSEQQVCQFYRIFLLIRMTLITHTLSDWYVLISSINKYCDFYIDER